MIIDEIISICNTLISLDCELFYGSALYTSVLNNKEYDKLIERLNTTNKINVNL